MWDKNALLRLFGELFVLVGVTKMSPSVYYTVESTKYRKNLINKKYSGFLLQCISIPRTAHAHADVFVASPSLSREEIRQAHFPSFRCKPSMHPMLRRKFNNFPQICA